MLTRWPKTVLDQGKMDELVKSKVDIMTIPHKSYRVTFLGHSRQFDKAQRFIDNDESELNTAASNEDTREIRTVNFDNPITNRRKRTAPKTLTDFIIEGDTSVKPAQTKRSKKNVPALISQTHEPPRVEALNPHPKARKLVNKTGSKKASSQNQREPQSKGRHKKTTSILPPVPLRTPAIETGDKESSEDDAAMDSSSDSASETAGESSTQHSSSSDDSSLHSDSPSSDSESSVEVGTTPKQHGPPVAKCGKKSRQRDKGKSSLLHRLHALEKADRKRRRAERDQKERSVAPEKPSQIPVKSVAELTTLNTELATNTNLKRKMALYLSMKASGRDLRNVVYSISEGIFTVSFARTLNIRGSYKNCKVGSAKTPLKDFKNIIDIINVSACMVRGYEESDLKKIKKYIGRSLQLASDKQGGREDRR